MIDPSRYPDRPLNGRKTIIEARLEETRLFGARPRLRSTRLEGHKRVVDSLLGAIASDIPGARERANWWYERRFARHRPQPPSVAAIGWIADWPEWLPELLNEHEAWFCASGVGAKAKRKWLRDIESPSHRDGAIFEAGVRRVLQRYCDEVVPGERPNQGGPDFICTTGGAKFAVEAKSLHVNPPAWADPLADPLAARGGPVRIPLREYEEALHRACRQARRAAPRMPVVVAVGCLRPLAAQLMFDNASQLLTGAPSMAVAVGPAGPCGDLHLTTDLHWTPFLAAPSAGDPQLEAKAKDIAAAMVISPQAFQPWHDLAAPEASILLNPVQDVRFDPSRCLPGMPWASLDPEWQSGRLLVRWGRASDDAPT